MNQNQFQIDINNYKIIKKIANGAFSFVYLIQNKEDKLYYAAKVITDNNENSKKNQTINREISIIKHYEHPTIIKFLGYSLTDFNGENKITIIMNLAKNGSLAYAIKKAQNSLADYQYDNTARQIILAGIACGMMYLHSHQIIHHDLKPQNILLDDNYYPLITDFGLSKFSDSESDSNPSGTPIYMAPEILSNAKYDQKSDVYSFGIIMYEVVTELNPYPSLESGQITIQNFTNKVVNHNYRPIFQVPVKKSIKELIEKCWSKNSIERPTFKEIFKKLAFKKLDEDCFLDDVDFDRLSLYIKSITQNENYFSDNEEEEEKFSIVNFNELCLKDQQLKIIQMIANTQNVKTRQLLSKINEFLIYLKNLNFISENDSNFLKIKSIEFLNRIYVPSRTTQLLFQNESFECEDFIILLKEFEISFEIEFPSKNFNSIYNVLKRLKSMKKSRIKISLIIKENELLENDIEINEAIFSSSIKRIINRAFFNNSTIQKISLPSSIEIIGDLSFFNCSQLFQINIPSSVTSIGNNAFEGCTSLESISIPSSITIINSSCFCRCSNLKRISIPSSVKKIGRNSFRECSSLRQISIPSSVELIGDNVFAGCCNLLEISLPENLISLGMHVFRRCISLIQINIPFFVPSIRRYSFNECLSLRQISIPNSVVIIEDFAFDGCSNLEIISIPSSVVEIGRSSFSRCSNLKEIKIPSSVRILNDSSFWGCLKLKNVIFESSDFLIEIGHFVFSGCSSLTEILIPSSVSHIGVSAFFDCSSLQKISMPPSINSIESSTFSECLSLKKIEIPENITEINECAFFGCSSLVEVFIPSSVSLIGDYAFGDCISLKKIAIPSSFTNIGEDAFPEGIDIVRY